MDFIFQISVMTQNINGGIKTFFWTSNFPFQTEHEYNLCLKYKVENSIQNNNGE